MKILICLALAILIVSCTPKSDMPTTTKTVTTVTTTTPAPDATAAPAPAPAVHVSSLSQGNLDMIQNDMSQAEVEAILGKPTNSSSQPIPIVGGTETTYTYQDGDSAVTVVFKNNQVKEKKGVFNP